MADPHHIMVETLTVAETEAGERLDRLLASRLERYSRSRLKAIILAGEVSIAGRTIRDPGHRVNAGAKINLVEPPPQPALPVAEAMALVILHEDDDLIVIDKPAGLVVHPAAGHWTGTLVHALIAHCGDKLSGIGGVRRPGIVHRLDKDTSGVMVVAKTDQAHRSLAAQFADHGRTGALIRTYLAFAWGTPDRPRGTIDAPLRRHPKVREKMAVHPEGRPAVTHWEIVETYRGLHGDGVASLLSCRLETGRTHQIRAHLAHIGHPVMGDTVYGSGFRTKAALLHPKDRENLTALDRQALHAHMLGVVHPASGQFATFRSELPDDLARLRRGLASSSAQAAARTRREN